MLLEIVAAVRKVVVMELLIMMVQMDRGIQAVAMEVAEQEGMVEPVALDWLVVVAADSLAMVVMVQPHKASLLLGQEENHFLMVELVELEIAVVIMADLAVEVALDIMVIIMVELAVEAVGIQVVADHVAKITGVLVVAVAHIVHLTQIHHQVHQEHGKVMVK